MNGGRQVIVKELPEKLLRGRAHLLFEEMQPFFEANRGSFVFDFSQVREIDSAGVGVLLRCLEEVMKGNGDIKFSSLSEEAAEVLELTGVHSLFEIFENNSLAVNSFQIFSGQSQLKMANPQYPYPFFENGTSDIELQAEFQSRRISQPLEGS